MNKIYGFLFLVLNFISCSVDQSEKIKLSWQTILEKGRSSSLVILVADNDITDEHVFTKLIKSANDSFGIKIQVVHENSLKIPWFLLQDSKKSKHTRFDLVIGTSYMMEELDKLGLLYSDYDAMIPNMKNISLQSIRLLSSHNLRRQCFTPFTFKRDFVMYDSCVYENGPSLDSLSNIFVVNDPNALNYAYFFSSKQNTLQSDLIFKSFFNERITTGINDSLREVLSSHIVDLNEIDELAHKIYVLSPIEFQSVKSLKNAKAIFSNGLPVLNKVIAISNTSENIFGSLIFVNMLLEHDIQKNNIDFSEGNYAPVINMAQ